MIRKHPRLHTWQSPGYLLSYLGRLLKPSKQSDIISERSADFWFHMQNSRQALSAHLLSHICDFDISFVLISIYSMI
jgi:hypothetical protein